MNARPPLTPVPYLRRTEPSRALIPRPGQALLTDYRSSEHPARSLMNPFHPRWRQTP